MYFEGDPLFFQDPIFNAVPTDEARARLIAHYDHEVSSPEWALGWRWNIVLKGPQATPFENDREKQK
jgi:protocatechuate 3,4-dioxygenase beta subunit